MKPFLKTTLIIVGVILLFAVGAFCLYAFYIFPKLKPMLDYDLAHNYSRILSQTEFQDLSALAIPVPTNPTTLSESDTRRILQRLHDTGHFPEWKPEYKLLDSEGKHLEFTIRLKEASDRSVVVYSSEKLRSGDFAFSVKTSNMVEAIDFP